MFWVNVWWVNEVCNSGKIEQLRSGHAGRGHQPPETAGEQFPWGGCCSRGRRPAASKHLSAWSLTQHVQHITETFTVMNKLKDERLKNEEET